ncbi:hypothetical protein GCWU000325_00199 [Alloprevotella tannerae ATCC 51259]|uniref:Uncharacterized protein n=1 Tax=Alloprevotella tannerae ATCC 51259 TaxID=626522 RepID=C9LDD0_9BACT|nr:hypothetical protein GCWU000325_00199 [Alloprevotella tannerae ATCC 51259]
MLYFTLKLLHLFCVKRNKVGEVREFLRSPQVFRLKSIIM